MRTAFVFYFVSIVLRNAEWTIQNLLCFHMASAATPICLGEWSGTGETSKDLSKEISFFTLKKKA